ncbi:MAG: 4-hydroxythreonine-4-phosphate dehydrogenase PdxA [Bacteroidales bacterium]|jgi:4-hydroxythreonine-4-phosphate dehydrogenase|nr:4-hydroxythreonine-4-phosphate dehydrogenase PdxA [Bacteroidales bacterium]
MNKIKIGITQGDINGISYEVILKTLTEVKAFSNIIPIIYGSPKVIAYYKKAFNNNVNTITVNTAEEAKSRNIHIINCNSEDIRVELGKSTEMAGLASYQALEKACEDLKEGKIDVLVTGSINKKNIQEAGFNFPGHSEYLSNKFDKCNHIMLMVNDIIKVGVVTGHIPIREVPKAITKELILEKLTILNNCLINDFLVQRPRIAVLSLNPHAGDEGIIGDEEIREIIPAINTAKEQDILAFGPYSADGFFGSLEFKKFDAVLAMYHDQGLIPFKVLAFESGVNYTAGLPIIRTSPSHGTAYDIAGKGTANEQSFRNAIYTAIEIFENRRLQNGLIRNRMNLDELEDVNEINQIDE